MNFNNHIEANMNFNNLVEAVLEKKEKRRLDPKCWKGYRKMGTKLKDGTRVNKCVKVNK